MKSDRMVKELELIRDKLYREQPDTVSTMNSLINLLQYAMCEHEWESKRMGGAPDTPDALEIVTYCKKCGADKLEDE